MQIRSWWFVVGVVASSAVLPGCQILNPNRRPAESPEVAEFILPPPPTPVSRSARPLDKAETQSPAVQEKVSNPPDKPAPDPPPIVAQKDHPVTVKFAPLVLALQCVLDDHHQDALHHLQAYDAETQEFYLRILPTLTIFAKKRVNELTMAEVAVLNDQLLSLLATLRPRTELAIDRMCCCEWVKAFGIYQPLAEGHTFTAPAGGDRPGDLVSLYVELRNFASVPRGGYFETRLSSTIEIRDAQGQKAQQFDFKDGKKPLKTLTRLNDYYNIYTFPVPSLPPGTYHVVLEIADETVPEARRVAQKTMELRITGAGANR